VPAKGKVARVAPAYTDPVRTPLRDVEHVRELEFRGSLGTGLPSLKRLTKLQYLFFSGSITDAGLECLTNLSQLRALSFYCCSGITDDGLKHLHGLTGLKYLQLYREDSLRAGFRGTLITDGGLVHLKDLASLENLNLIGQRITDKGMVEIAALTNLRGLLLRGDQITDAGLKQLHRLKHLRQLHLDEARVTPDGVAALKSKLPDLDESSILQQAKLNSR
jgi:hypothetical protein